MLNRSRALTLSHANDNVELNAADDFTDIRFIDSSFAVLKLEGGVRPSPSALLARMEAPRPYQVCAALHRWTADAVSR